MSDDIDGWPVADLGIAVAKQQQQRQAVQAGAQYAASHP